MTWQLPTSPVFNAMNFKDESNTLISISDSGRRFARKIDNQKWKFTCSYKLLTRAEFAPILAFITKQRGQKETFTVIPPKIKDSLKFMFKIIYNFIRFVFNSYSQVYTLNGLAFPFTSIGANSLKG